MASNPLTDYPEYLLAYSGTGTYKGWSDAILEVLDTLSKKFDIAVARERMAKMTMYWCVEVGESYKAPLVYHKFARCYMWPDFKAAFDDSWLVDEWNDRRNQWKVIEERRVALAKIPSIPPDAIIHDFYSRDVLMTLLEQCTYRHGVETAKANNGLFCNLVSIYGWQALSRLTDSPVRDEPWLAPLRKRDKIPNLLNTFWIEKYLNDNYGDDLIRYKEFTHKEREEELIWLTTASTATTLSQTDTSTQEVQDLDSSQQDQLAELPIASIDSIENTIAGDVKCPKKSKKRSKTSVSNSQENLSKKNEKQKPICKYCNEEIEWSGKGRRPIKCKKEECHKAYHCEKTAESRARNKE